jgi:N-acetyl-1-D-myo-inositol-2-amino-2-deoxy-alpha-D-glucopyranoside deacetylase
MSGMERDLAGHALLAVFAHPDDESLASGGLLSWCAARGARVSLLCVSRGEAGTGPDHLGDRRARELRDAAAALGLTEVMLLRHPDGLLPWLDHGVLASDVLEAIGTARPDVVVTFGDDGLYWHPDHIAVHEATRDAVASLGDRAPALFYVTMPPGQMEAVLAVAATRLGPAARHDLLGITDAAAFGAAAQPPTLVLHTGSFAARKLAALRCHRTQVADGPFDQLSAQDAIDLLGVEHYRRADVGAPGPAFIERLQAAPSLENS